jgi:hypothetical protein
MALSSSVFYGYVTLTGHLFIDDLWFLLFPVESSLILLACLYSMSGQPANQWQYTCGVLIVYTINTPPFPSLPASALHLFPARVLRLTIHQTACQKRFSQGKKCNFSKVVLRCGYTGEPVFATIFVMRPTGGTTAVPSDSDSSRSHRFGGIERGNGTNQAPRDLYSQ